MLRRSHGRPPFGAADGVLAMVAGYAVAWVVGEATNQPFIANGIADRIMEATPLGIASALLSALGVAAKPFALAGALAVAAALAAAAAAACAALPTWRLTLPASSAGAVEHPTLDPRQNPEPRRQRSRAAARLAALLVLGALQAGVVLWLAGLPSWQAALVPYSVWVFVAAALAAERDQAAPEQESAVRRAGVAAAGGQGALGPEPVAVRPAGVAADPGERKSERRWFLRRGVQAAGGLALLSTAATWTLLAKTLAGARPGRMLFDFRAPAAREPAFAGVEGLTPEVTPIASFYLMSKTVEDPAVAVDSWRLRVTGLVSRPLQLTYEDLPRLPRVDQWLTLRCVSNPVGGPLIGNALWSGVPVPALLSLAGVQAQATTLILKGRDTYADSVPLERARQPTSLLAYAVNGDFLNRDHGFPARVLVPGLYGFKNVKWVDEVEVAAAELDGPWQRLGWTRTAVQTTFSRIDFVRRAGAGALAGGIAFAGDRGIRSVEVRAGEQPWRAARLHTPPLGSLSWMQWLFPFEATGRVTVTVRATDGAGALQERAERPIFPDGATGWHSVTVDLPAG